MDLDSALLFPVSLLLFSIAASVFFSGVEIAFVSSASFKLDQKRNKLFIASDLISFFHTNPAPFVTSMLFGRLLSLVLYVIALSYFIERAMYHFFPIPSAILLVVQIALSSFFLYLFSKLSPRSFFQTHASSILTRCIVPATVSHLIFYPVAKGVVVISLAIVRAITRAEANIRQDKHISGSDVHGHYYGDSNKQKHSKDDERNLKILANAIDFAEIKIRECIIPRTQLVAVSVTDTVEHLRHKFSSSGNSKILVYEGSIDNIIGYIHHSRLFELPVASVKRMTREAPFVPDTMPAKMLLSILVKSNKSIAVVVDEFGGTAGIVTIEDIMEEIIGKIEDEHEKSGIVDKRLSDNEFEFSGRIEIDYINEKYGLSIDTCADYETIAGLVLHTKGNIPKLNETITIGSAIFTIIEVSPTRIERLRLKLNLQTN